MAEIPPVVYDIAQPTPVTLKELSAIAVSLEIWRHEIRKHRMNSTIEKFDPTKLDISSKTTLPDLPSVIYDAIDEYIPRFGPSATKWLWNHYVRIFQLQRTDPKSVLEVFDDFVADFYGTIDYVKTAKRMMMCDRFSDVEKFAIACTYFFEDDIGRIWPSVCQNFDSSSMNFYESPQLYYWICCLRNETDKIPNRGNRSIDEVMLEHHMVRNRPSFEYFWNRVPVENRMSDAIINLRTCDEELFISFGLSKLNDQQLDEFINTNDGYTLIFSLLLNNHHPHQWLFQPTWNFLKNSMNENTFRILIVKMLQLEQATSTFEGYAKEPPYWLYHCSVIWNSIPTNSKRSIIGDILSDTRLFENIRSPSCTSRRFVGFLLIILPSATFGQRSTFWRHCWPHLIQGTRIDDLKHIMGLCFENEDKIAQFKGGIFARSENVRLLCVRLLRKGMMDELNDLVDFCWPEVQAANRYKLHLLQATFLGFENMYLGFEHIERVKELSVFIHDAFDSKDEAADFKNQLVSSPATQNYLLRFRRPNFSIEGMMELVDTFVLAEQTRHAIKRRMIGVLIESIGHFDHPRFKTPVFDRFLLWLFGSTEDVERFRQDHPIEFNQR
ncbi:uncharacterized protein LOC135847616 isoform X5 [Planococcus citri]|uniref:uncharacterized protein LOC135847616 isoform X5 n=1 Tax=Planococcus citri TaxID=170843 RepID=UPI0031F95429